MSQSRVKRVLWSLLGLVAATCVIIVTVLYWLIATMNTDAGRQRIESIVGYNLKREVHIGGPIDLELSLRPRVSIEGLTISNPDWAQSPVFVSVKRAAARVEILPLLVRRLQIREFDAAGIRLWLEQQTDGTANWQFGKWLKEKWVESANVEDARVSFRRGTGLPLEADFSRIQASIAPDLPLQLEATAKIGGLPATVALHGGALDELMSAEQPWSVTGKAELGGNRAEVQGTLMQPVAGAGADLVADVRGDDLTVLERLLGRSLPTLAGYHVTAQVHTDEHGYSIKAEASADEVTAVLPDEVSDVLQSVTAKRISGRFQSEGASVAELIERADWRIAAQVGPLGGEKGGGGKGRREPRLALNIADMNVGSESGGPVHLTLDGTLNGVPLQMRGNSGTLGDLLQGKKSIPLHVSLTAEGLKTGFDGKLSVAEGQFEGDLTFFADDLGPIGRLTARRLPPLGPVRLSARLVRRAQSFHAKPGSLQIGDSRFDWHFDLTPRASPRGSLILTRGQIDFADLEKLAAAKEPSAAEGSAAPKDVAPKDATAEGAQVIPTMSLPIELVRGLDIEMLIRKLRLVSFGDVVGRLEAGLRALDGRLTISLTGEGISLKSKGNFVLDTAVEPPSLDFALDFRDVDYGLLIERLGLSDKVQGSLDLHADLVGRGTSLRAVLADADGGVTFSGGQGRVPRALLELWGGGVINALLGILGGSEQTRLVCAVGRFSISDGMLGTEVLLVDTSDVTIGGDLALNLKTEALDGIFRARSKYGSLVKMGRPIELSGTLAEPHAEFAGSRLVEFGKLIIGLSDPRALILLFGELGAKEKNPCKALLEQQDSKQQDEKTAPAQ